MIKPTFETNLVDLTRKICQHVYIIISTSQLLDGRNKPPYLINRSHGLKSRSHDLIIRSHNLKNRSHDLIIRSHGLKSRSHGLIIRSHGLKIRSHDLVN